MDSNQLKYIAYLTQTTSLTKVAEHFFTSHQVVKKAITNLEDELQVTLLQSTNQGSHLTPAGLCVAKHAEAFQQQYTALTEDLKEFQQTITDITELHLYVTPSMATEYYIDLYDRFFDEIGNSRLILHSTTFPQMLKEADKSQNNLFLTPLAITNEMQLLLHNLLEKNNFDSIAFQPVRNYLCMHKSSRYANFTAPTLNDVIDVPIYVFLNTNPLCMSGDDPMMSLQYFSDYTVLKRNIKKHHAVGVLKKYEFNYYFGENNSEYILKPLNDLKMQYIVIGSEEILHKNPIVQDFVHFLQNTLKD